MITSDYDPTRELLPEKGWLAEYVKLTNGLSACPRFRFFTSLCALGAAVGNKISLQRGSTGTLFPKFFPNPWIVLLAPPGRGYKTSTISMACNCLTKALPEVRILSDKITPEAIVQALSAPVTQKEIIRIGPRDATGLIKAPELSVFFGKQQYNVSLVSLITDLYDYRETWISETIGRGKNVLKNVCLSILGGSTPAWLQQMLPQDAFTGGFMSRFIIVEMPPTYYLRRTFPEEPPKHKWESLIDQLSTLGRLEGEIEWDLEARSSYDEIYQSYKPCGEVQLDAYKEREAEHILKCSMLLAIAEGDLILKAEHLKMARKIIKSLEAETSPRIERLSTHPRMHLTLQIQDTLRLYGEVSEATLLKMVYKDLSLGERQFYETLSVLRRAGIIDPTGKPGDYSYKLRERKRKKDDK